MRETPTTEWPCSIKCCVTDAPIPRLAPTTRKDFIFFGLTLFGHTNFQFNHQGDKKVDNSCGLCSMGSMSEGKERIVAEHPKAWVVRMVEGCGWWKGAA